MTYIDALTEQKDYEASGLLYLGLIDNIYKATKNTEDTDLIEAEIRKAFKMKGIVLADLQVVKAMDKNIEQTKKSDIIPVSLKSDGSISGSSAKTAEELESLQKQVKKVIKSLASEIMKGNIDIKPYNYKGKTGCDFCNYRTICNFSTSLKCNNFDYIN